MDEELRIQVTARRGRDVRKAVFKRYLPGGEDLSHFFTDFAAEIEAVLEKILRR